MKYFYQCRLKNGNAETVAWIEDRGAKIGNRVELLSADGKFWEVIQVYRHGLAEDALKEKQKADRNSLPSIRVAQ